ncbi:short chain dehydrogenase [Trypanosoma rangeli]|uniref:3-dehydrosphinganine reductase n=1 Tax=Trypanosoma rangeli TaxID=5698 RepID=A0A422NNE9_TRYRA|nr:short chain dehydrogenase [Trypanosoma rangeli]RNF06946.1 short chain dehydrogenase [Trypanosoma rangeli]|eukprot:RNF06946.1 short chain dehydrogenase [Trypanosoma rangeli]
MMFLVFAAGGLVVAAAVLVAAAWSVQRVPPFNIADCHALVTGGSTGIGLETARQLVRQGAKVVVVSARRTDVLRAAVAELRAEAGKDGTQVFYVEMDVSDEASVARAVNEVEATMTGGAGLDLVVCNAGFSIPLRFLETSADDVRRMLEVNYFGCVHVVRAVLPAMLQRRRGRIVLVSSLASRCAIAGYSSYAASKAAVRAFAHSLDMENSCLGVRFQVVCPPDIETPGLHSENLRKSPECKAISSFGGNVPYTAEAMGRCIVKNIKRYRFDVVLGSDAVLLSLGSAGIEPATSLLELLFQFLFAGWLRLIMAVYSKLHYRIVQRVRGEEVTPVKDKDV